MPRPMRTLLLPLLRLCALLLLYLVCRVARPLSE